jgi:hypothetical protein
MVQNWALGVMMNISGSVIINLGTNLMKLGHNKRQASAEQKSEVVSALPENNTCDALFSD